MKVEPPAPSPTEVAADLFTRAAKIVPDEPEPFIILGVLCVIKSDYEAAIRHMKSALENDPSDYTLWNKLGAVQVRLDAISQRLCSSSGASSSGANSGCAVADAQLSARASRGGLQAGTGEGQCPRPYAVPSIGVTVKACVQKIRPGYNRAVENLRRLQPQGQ